MKPSDFYTRKQATDGVRMPLFDKRGRLTSEWILVRGIDSAEYRTAHDAFHRMLVRLVTAVRAQGSDAMLSPESDAQREAADLAEKAALVAGWSLEGECTQAAILELLDKAPYVGDQIVAFATDRDGFFGDNSALSTAGPSTKLDSASQQPQGPITP